MTRKRFAFTWQIKKKKAVLQDFFCFGRNYPSSPHLVFFHPCFSVSFSFPEIRDHQKWSEWWVGFNRSKHGHLVQFKFHFDMGFRHWEKVQALSLLTLCRHLRTLQLLKKKSWSITGSLLQGDGFPAGFQSITIIQRWNKKQAGMRKLVRKMCGRGRIITSKIRDFIHL